MLILESFFLLFLLVFVLFCTWYFFDALFCKEDYVTNKDTTKKLANYFNENYPKGGIFYDLGSSRGGFALDLIEKCPQLQITGIDNSLLRIWISKLRAWVGNKKVIFKKEDIFKTDVSKADLVYVYIPLVLLPKLALKLEKELPRQATVVTSVSNPINLTKWEPTEVIPKDPKNENERNIFVYKFPFRKNI